MIVSISGRKRNGKDSVADILVKEFKYVKISLADPLRNIAVQVFSLPEEFFLQDNLKEQPFTYPIIMNEEHLGFLISHVENEWNMSVDSEAKEKLLNRVGAQFKHPRHLLQELGTTIIRGCIDNDIFLKLADQRIGQLADVVIADVRTSREREWAASKNALMCFVNRPNYQREDSHISENDFGNESEYNVIFNNTGTLSEFQHDIKMWLHSHPRFRYRTI